MVLHHEPLMIASSLNQLKVVDIYPLTLALSPKGERGK
jgi:hypothetical protein